MAKVRVKRVGALYKIEYKKHFFSRWRNVGELGVVGTADNRNTAKERAKQVKAMLNKPLVEIMEEL